MTRVVHALLADLPRQDVAVHREQVINILLRLDDYATGRMDVLFNQDSTWKNLTSRSPTSMLPFLSASWILHDNDKHGHVPLFAERLTMASPAQGELSREDLGVRCGMYMRRYIPMQQFKEWLLEPYAPYLINKERR